MLDKPAKNWAECKRLAFEHWGNDCLFGYYYPGYIHKTNVIDPAHIFGKGSHPHLALVPLNIIPLERYVHTLIDQNIHPINGQFITKIIREDLFKILIGIDNYNRLEELNLTLRKQCNRF